MALALNGKGRSAGPATPAGNWLCAAALNQKGPTSLTSLDWALPIPLRGKRLVVPFSVRICLSPSVLGMQAASGAKVPRDDPTHVDRQSDVTRSSHKEAGLYPPLYFVTWLRERTTWPISRSLTVGLFKNKYLCHRVSSHTSHSNSGQNGIETTDVLASPHWCCDVTAPRSGSQLAPRAAGQPASK